MFIEVSLVNATEYLPTTQPPTPTTRPVTCANRRFWDDNRLFTPDQAFSFHLGIHLNPSEIVPNFACEIVR